MSAREGAATAPGQAPPDGTFSAWMDAEQHWSTGYAYNAGDMESAFHGGWKCAVTAAAAAQGAPEVVQLRASLMAAHKEGRAAWAQVEHLKAQVTALRIALEREPPAPAAPAAAAELAEAMRETREVRDGYARLCDEFSDSPQSGQSARISLTVLNRHRAAAGLKPRKPAPAGERRDPYMQAIEERDEARAKLSDQEDDFLFERKQVVALRQVLTEIFTCLNTADMSLLEADQVDEWRERAGIEDL